MNKDMLERIRKIFQMSQLDVAKALGFTSHNGYRYKLNTNNGDDWNLADIKKLCALYGLSIIDLLLIDTTEELVLEKAKIMKQFRDNLIKEELERQKLLKDKLLNHSTTTNSMESINTDINEVTNNTINNNIELTYTINNKEVNNTNVNQVSNNKIKKPLLKK